MYPLVRRSNLHASEIGWRGADDFQKLSVKTELRREKEQLVGLRC